MLKVVEIIPAGHWHEAPADRVALDQDGRHRRRIVLNGERGLRALLDLPQATQLRHGDGLRLDDGSILEVLALPEALLEVRGVDAAHLLRLAWHIGNRHLAAEIEPERILIRHDRVIAEMLRGLGAEVAETAAPFDPVGGAYDAPDAGHGHHHHHDHDHPHSHD